MDKLSIHDKLDIAMRAGIAPWGEYNETLDEYVSCAFDFEAGVWTFTFSNATEIVNEVSLKVVTVNG